MDNKLIFGVVAGAVAVYLLLNKKAKSATSNEGSGGDAMGGGGIGYLPTPPIVMPITVAPLPKAERVMKEHKVAGAAPIANILTSGTTQAPTPVVTSSQGGGSGGGAASAAIPGFDGYSNFSSDFKTGIWDNEN